MILSVPAFVRVRALRRGSLVEFDYMLGDGDLSVELILPLAAFDEFCLRMGARVSDDDAILRGAGNTRRPGLYRPRR